MNSTPHNVYSDILQLQQGYLYVEHIGIFCNNEYNVELHFNIYNIL